MKAILTASIPHQYKAFTFNDDEFDVYGAGVVDARSSFYTLDNNRYITDNFAANSADASKKTYTFYVSEGEKIRVSLSWLKYATISGTHATATPADYSLADLDLYIYGPYDEFITSSVSLENNTEVASFEAIASGTYKIEVRQYSNSDKKVYFGLAWW